jgi:hypothetical protein
MSNVSKLTQLGTWSLISREFITCFYFLLVFMVHQSDTINHPSSIEVFRW